MKLVGSERNGEAFDSQLVVGVRESYVNLCSNPEDKLLIYRQNFETSYIESTRNFYKSKANEFLYENGIHEYMKFADNKLSEEKLRGNRYLEDSSNSSEALQACLVDVLVSDFKDVILAECSRLISENNTEKLHLMYTLMKNVPDGIAPMLENLEKYITTAGLSEMMSAAETITQDSEQLVDKLLSLFNRLIMNNIYWLMIITG